MVDRGLQEKGSWTSANSETAISKVAMLQPGTQTNSLMWSASLPSSDAWISTDREGEFKVMLRPDAPKGPYRTYRISTLSKDRSGGGRRMTLGGCSATCAIPHTAASSQKRVT